MQLPTSLQVKQIQELILAVWQNHGVEPPLDLAALGSQLKKSNAELDWKDNGFKSLKPLVAYYSRRSIRSIPLRQVAKI